MPLPPGEPDSPAAVARWIGERTAARDRFAHVRRASERHRAEHGPTCTVYPTGNALTLAVLAAAAGARRIIEIGCGLGYSALWLACGAGTGARMETIERDPAHAALAERAIAHEGYADRITVRRGAAVDMLPCLPGPYDLIFCDAEPADYPAILDQNLRLLRPGGLLLTSNLFLGQHDPDAPGLDEAAACRARLLDDPGLLTSFLPGGLALSVRLA
jgi:predicted O-methyltransferase YrrM